MAGIWQTETFAAVIGPKGIAQNAETWLMATGHGAASQEADADHAASWHPLVALSVADLLDRFAGCDCDEDGDHWAEKAAALNVARVFLGEAAS